MKILYEKDNGTVGKLITPSPGSVLESTPSWLKLDARNIPYTSAKSGAIASVEIALDMLLTKIQQINELAINAERNTQAVSRDTTDVFADLGKRIAEINSYTTDAVNRFQRLTHRPVSISIVSNPALSLDAVNQQVRLDLKAENSFDDSKASLGATNVQAAIEKLAAQVSQLIEENKTLRQALNVH